MHAFYLLNTYTTTYDRIYTLNDLLFIIQTRGVHRSVGPLFTLYIVYLTGKFIIKYCNVLGIHTLFL